MKFLAETVIDDCKLALKELEIAEKENNFDTIRIRWLTCLVLNRAIGHVLNKVDTPDFEEHKSIFIGAFSKHKYDKIFTEFIEYERNEIIKKYTAYIENEVSINEENIRIITEGGDCLITENGHNIITEQTESIKRYFIKSDGFGKDLLLHQVVFEAITWWETLITEIKIGINND